MKVWLEMRVVLLALLVSPLLAENGSLECYQYPNGNGNGNGNNNNNNNWYEPVVVPCECDVNEMAQFIQHVGNQCFSGGTIPQEFPEYFDFGDGCNVYGNNNNNNNDMCEEEQQMQNFWCGCLSSYIKKYGRFSEQCWIPDISEAMREMGGGAMERAWDEMECEWWEYSVERVMPNDISMSLGAASETCNENGTESEPVSWNNNNNNNNNNGRRRLQNNWYNAGPNYLGGSAECSSASTRELGSICLEAVQDQNTMAIVGEDLQISLDYNAIKAAYLESTGVELQCGVRCEWDNGAQNCEWADNENGEMLAWEIRKGWVFDENNSSKGVATRYGNACSQEYTGEVLVTYAYPTETNDYGYVEEERGEREVFWGDLTETYGPLYVGYDGTSIQYPRCQNWNNGNNNNNNNNGNQNCDEEGPEEGQPNLAQALSYLLYNPTDVDMYSLVISCGSEQDMAESQEDQNNNNNNNQQSEECEYEEKEMCENKLSQWAKPIVCTNFFVASDQIVEVPVDDEDSSGRVCQGIDAGDNSACSANSDQDSCSGDERCEWVVAGGSRNGGGNNNNNGGSGLEQESGGDSGMVSTIKTVAIVVLAIGCFALCFMYMKKGGKEGYSSTPDAARDTTPLRDDQL